ncbi:MAG: acyloxyacyl hydrolase [Syntrophorhabdales bacterium]
MKRSLQVSLIIAASLILSQPVWASENNFSVGYGFALWSEKHSVGNIAEGPYNFVQAAYSHEMPISQKWLIQAGPYLAYVMRPTDGVDVGLNLGVKAYPFSRDHSGFFFTLGTGGAYSTIAYTEQATHAFFILQGSIGYRYKNFYIEDRYRHYSNAGTSSPNRSINANIISLGMYF